jgi:hypothetical protein
MNQIVDCLNNQFRLYSYLADINSSIVQYVENNNLNINYYCIISKIVEKTHYLITSNTIKNNENGYRLITINENDQDHDDNNIIYNNNKIHIYYDNLTITIGSLTQDINSQIANYNIQVDSKIMSTNVINNEILLHLYYDRNIVAEMLTELHVYHKETRNRCFSNLFPNVRALNMKGKLCETCLLLPNLTILTIANFPTTTKPFHIKNKLPQSLQSLTFDRYYGNNTFDYDILPTNLRTLTFNYVNRPLNANILPPNLHTLILNSFDQPINPNVLPPNLHTLNLGNRYNHQINQNILPPNLHTLALPARYNKLLYLNVYQQCSNILTNKTLCYNILPKSLKIINFTCANKTTNKTDIVPIMAWGKIRHDNVMPTYSKIIKILSYIASFRYIIPYLCFIKIMCEYAKWLLLKTRYYKLTLLLRY